MATKPTILIVPGSFAPPTFYDATIAHMRKLGYPAVELRLPSTVKRMPLEPATMMDDADVIRRASETLLNQGKEVVVVCHSYGGTPTSQGLAGLKVKRIVYFSAIVPRVGESVMTHLGAEGGVPMEAVGGYMHIDTVAFAAATCSDMSWELAYENTLTLQHHSAVSFLEKVTQVAYKDVPVSYIFCEDDLLISPEKQRGFIKVIEEDSRKKVEVARLKSGHAPNCSMLEKLGDVIISEAERA